MSEPLEHGSKTAIEEATEHQPVRMPYPCRRIAKVAKTTLVSALIILTVLGSVDTVLPGIIQALAASALPETVGQNTRCMPTPPNATATTSYDALRCSSLTSQTPQIVGADEVPNLSLPKTVISSINTLIGAGGVVQTSPDNLTIYNLGLAVRLLANPFPHDVLLGPGHRALNSSSSWNVEVSISKLWVRLVPVSSRFTILGTNSSGTFVVRTTSVATGVYSGTLVVVYHARPDGSLKWSVGFTPASSGDYAFVYDWLNTTRASLPVGEDRSFRSRIGSANYTFSWSDVPRSLNATSTASSTEFSLQIDMGTVQANSTFQIDPQLVSSSISSNPTGFTFQRKIFYDANSGYYFAFYYDGYLVGYSSSHDGLGWSARQQMAPNWPGYNNDPASLPYIYNSGGTVWAVSGEETVACTGCANTVHAYVASGNVSTSSIIWQPTQKIISFKSLSDPSLFRPTFGFRYVSVALDAGSRLAFSYNFYASDQTGGLCYQGAPKESVLGVIYNNQNFLASCNSNDQNQERSVIVPAPGGLRLVYQDHAGSSFSLASSMEGPVAHSRRAR